MAPLVSAGETARDRDCNDGLPVRHRPGIYLFKSGGGYQTGRGQSVALNQLFVEFVMADCDAVEVFRIAEADRKRQNGEVFSGRSRDRMLSL